jgi:stage II sporulation protein D
VRVLLGSGQGSVGFTGAGRACGERLGQRRGYTFGVESGDVLLRAGGGDRIANCGREGKASSGIRIDGLGAYRGSLVARATGGNLLVINQLSSEDYVRGVVPNEVPPSWPAAALQAQAVVARSFGLATGHEGPFDHYADTRSQVYGGRGSETAATDRAVRKTAREIVTHRGDPAVTYYFSTSGGRTESSEFGFAGGSAIPYLRSVDDPFDDASPVHAWTERRSDDAMESALSGLFDGNLRKIDVIETGRSPRIVRARVVGSRGSSTVSGDTLRSRLELRSTWARFRPR